MAEPTNIDEIETDADNGDNDKPNCPDSPSGEHEFDVDEEAGDGRINCVYCGKEKD